MDILSSPFGDFDLQRLPPGHNESLRAWDSADELLLRYLADTASPAASDSILIVNDQFGALACSLHTYTLCSWTDSSIAHTATQHNLRLNRLTPRLSATASTAVPDRMFQWVLIKIPKTLALLEYQLIRLKACINSDTKVIAAGMVKYLQKSHTELFERYLGVTHSSLAAKKARLLFPSVEKLTAADHCPYPSRYLQQDLQLQLSNHANVFCRDKLDIGTRFIIEQYPLLPPARCIVDLGCGNGVLGIMAKRTQAKRYENDCRVHFIDESYMAIDSARTNYSNTFSNTDPQLLQQLFHIGHCFDNTPFTRQHNDTQTAEQIDLILCNPPFHQHHSVGDNIAWTMFVQSKNVLKHGGQLWIVGNRHLNYHSKLKRLFGNCRTVASNRKFVVLAATSTQA